MKDLAKVAGFRDVLVSSLLCQPDIADCCSSTFLIVADWCHLLRIFLGEETGFSLCDRAKVESNVEVIILNSLVSESDASGHDPLWEYSYEPYFALAQK